MPAVQPYINYEGNCEEAFTFYRSVFGGEFIMVSCYGDMPPQESMKMPEAGAKKIMHISLSIGSGIYLMGGEWIANAVQGNNIRLSINADSAEEADRIYNALSADGRRTISMGNTFWVSYFGMLTDKFGINRMVSCEPKHDDKAGQN